MVLLSSSNTAERLNPSRTEFLKINLVERRQRLACPYWLLIAAVPVVSYKPINVKLDRIGFVIGEAVVPVPSLSHSIAFVLSSSANLSRKQTAYCILPEKPKSK